MKVELLEAPTEKDWMEVKRRALVCAGLKPVNPPDWKWKRKMLQARHSPVRYLRFSFWVECPSWVATHLTRHHVGCQPYVKSQRNDRQTEYDRNAARQDAPVCMIWDLNAESLMEVANKRLCMQASAETREVVRQICELAADACPEIAPELVPVCERCGGICYEMHPCGRYPAEEV